MKKAVCIVLILCLALLPCAALAADSAVCFIAINDDLLPLTSQAYSQGGLFYVPVTVFTQLRLYSTYQSSTSTLEITSSSRQMFFNLATGETYDSNNTYYTASAIMRGGVVYVPVDFVCRQFGLSWSYIRGNGYGDLCRITDGTASLSDVLFMNAAAPLMSSRYNEYVGATVSPDANDGSVSNADSVIFLSFQGMPGDDMLTALNTYGIKATFFLTASEIAENPGAVRRIAGEGHNIGALCSSSPASEYSDFSSALWTAARMASVLVAAASRDYSDSCEYWAGVNGLVFCDYTVDGVRSGAGVTASELAAMLSGSRSPLIYLRIQCSRTTESDIVNIINTLRSGSSILAACETSEV